MEQRLIDVELARRALLHLLGPNTPIYNAADQAINTTAEAYRVAVTMRSQPLRSVDKTYPRREESDAMARAAVDAYRPLVQRWQTALQLLSDTQVNTTARVGGPRRRSEAERPTTQYGYAWVSPREPNLTWQHERLAAAGIAAEHIIVEKIAGRAAARPKLDELLAKLVPGDQVVVTRLWRIGRNHQHLLDCRPGSTPTTSTSSFSNRASTPPR